MSLTLILQIYIQFPPPPMAAVQKVVLHLLAQLALIIIIHQFVPISSSVDIIRIQYREVERFSLVRLKWFNRWNVFFTTMTPVFFSSVFDSVLFNWFVLIVGCVYLIKSSNQTSLFSFPYFLLFSIEKMLVGGGWSMQRTHPSSLIRLK